MKMISSTNKTTSTAAFLAAAMLLLSIFFFFWTSFGVFKGSLQESLPGFTTTKRKLIGNGI